MLDAYRRAQDGFDAVLDQIPAGAWDKQSECELWTVRDVVGHVVWGQDLVRHWATGEPFTSTEGAPGVPHPAPVAGPDPVIRWRAARAAADATLTPESITRTRETGILGTIPLTGFLPALVADFLAHSWDIGNACGLDVRLAPDLLPDSHEWVSANVIHRSPTGIGPELTPPDDADEQTRWLAFVGRKAW
ncbi:TIGR03086 family metal-binding protein [Actinocrispum wychmicini]|uniref:Uncharacterized protein (TIGR03086 family) n=1 Tax=Actinocrispum wychmicini TaxID=1213861 RepID=A0A4R2JT80_9PSEU|nr:TIGR03086 family metal-binding protein [Actinocrispum wychmicini]TCO60456.1 uncharacterized protein (TIGR03086 family) [Actinocrispum wychmicini]